MSISVVTHFWNFWSLLSVTNKLFSGNMTFGNTKFLLFWVQKYLHVNFWLKKKLSQSCMTVSYNIFSKIPSVTKQILLDSYMIISYGMFWKLKKKSILDSTIKNIKNEFKKMFYYQININNIWTLYVYIFSKIHLRSIFFFFYKKIWWKILYHFVLNKMEEKSTWYEASQNLKFLQSYST